MNKSKVLPLVNTVLIVILVISVLFLHSNNQQSIVYIDQTKLFNEFNMTNEIKANEDRKIVAIKVKLDSVFKSYSKIKDKESNQATFLQSQIQVNNKRLQEIQNDYVNIVVPKIFNRINTYIEEYAISNKLEFILSSDKSKSVIYSKSNLDYTDEILQYVNTRYEGGVSLTEINSNEK